MKIRMKLDQSGDQPGWYTMAQNKVTRHVDIYLYGVIGSYRVNVERLLNELQAAGEVNTITVYLNTVGGSFYDGLPIYNTLKQHKAVVTVRIMGYALSMGSIIMLAGDRIEAAENSLIMIHRARGGVYGDAEALQKGAEILIKHEAAMMPEYTRRMGINAKKVSKLLAAETWYTAPEAKAAGLVDALIDEVIIDKESAGMSADSMNYINENFQNIPDNLFNFQTKTNNQKDDEVTPEDHKAIAVEVVNLLKTETSTEELANLKQQLAAANTAREAAEAKAEGLTKVDPSKCTPNAENTGPAGGDRDWDQIKDFI